MSSSIQAQSVIYNNDKKDLLRAIESMANSVSYAGKNLISDFTLKYGDASPKRQFSDIEIENIKEKYRGIIDFEYVFFGFNSGSARGQNLLADGSEKDYIFIMNPDILPAPDMFIPLLVAIKDERVGMAEARQTPIEHHKEYDKETLETEWATGACTLVKTDLFHRLKGFDADTFFMYCDDVDLSWRVRLDGYKIIFRPDAMAFHAKRLSPNAGWKPTSAEVYYSAEAAIMMAYKWSNDDRAESLVNQFNLSGQEVYEKAAKHFLEMKRNKNLPKQLDTSHKVAHFNGDYYSFNRFTL